MKQFSKKILRLDYIIAIILLVAYFICMIYGTVNGYMFDFSAFTIVLTAWIGQLGLSSACYYILIKSEHKVQLPMQLINELPEDIKNNVDLTQIITTVLTSTDN